MKAKTKMFLGFYFLLTASSLLYLVILNTNLKSEIVKLNTVIVELNTVVETKNDRIQSITDEKNIKLAEKIIIQTYEELSSAGKRRKNNPVGDIIHNMNIIGNSYNGEDEDIIKMLIDVQEYLEYKTDNLYAKNTMDSFFKYGDARESVEVCISKYALFDKIGLYEMDELFE